MSPQAGNLLLEEIAPRLRSTIPYVVRKIGIDDTEELIQDAIVVAAQMPERIEQQGKMVTPGNIAYFTIRQIKSGRRSYGSGRTDVMMASTQLDGTSCVLSLEEEVGYPTEKFLSKMLTGERLPLYSRIPVCSEKEMHCARSSDEEQLCLGADL